MFNKKKNQESLDVFVSLSYNSLTVAYEYESELKLDSVIFDIQSDIDTLIKYWEKGVKKLLSDVSFKPYLVLLVNSSSFLVKNIQDMESENIRYDYVSKQLDIPIGSFEMTNIKNSAYLVVKHSSIEKILFAFKDFNIKSLYDLSIINSLYFLNKKDELYINISLNSVNIIHNGSIFKKRGIERLFLNYLKKSSQKLNLDLDSTYTHVKKNFSRIKSYQELMKSTQNGAVDLKDFIDDLILYIENTLKYFNDYDSLEYIETIYLDGDILDLEFLTDIISEKINLDNILPVNNQLYLNDYRKIASTVAYRVDQNILNSASIKLEGLRYSDGKQEYIFIDNSLVSEKKLSKEQKRRVIAFEKFIEEEENGVDIRGDRGKKRYKKPNKSIWKMNATELFELAKSKLSPENRIDSIGSGGETTEEDDDERVKIIILIFLFIFGAIYYLWLYISGLEKDFDRKVNNYVSSMQQVKILKDKLTSKNIIFIDKGINKILWTEKFITISKKMPDEIWFSSIRLETKEKNKSGETSRVILDGRCLPSSIGHIKTIAKYMERLMKADSNFRKDFIGISFGGAKSIYDEYNRNLISFQLYCDFKKDVNLKKIEQELLEQKQKIVDSNLSTTESVKKDENRSNSGKEK